MFEPHALVLKFSCLCPYSIDRIKQLVKKRQVVKYLNTNNLEDQVSNKTLKNT